MRALKILYLFLLAMLLSFNGFSQSATSVLTKNINNNAFDLTQELNAAHDTLRLKSGKDILRVSFLSHKNKKTVQIDLGVKEINIPLYHFAVGRYTVAVYREDKIIALGIDRVLPITKAGNAIVDLEESTLRASLSKAEQESRNMKPLPSDIRLVESTVPKKPSVTEEISNAIASRNTNPGFVPEEKEEKVVETPKEDKVVEDQKVVEIPEKKASIKPKPEVVVTAPKKPEYSKVIVVDKPKNKKPVKKHAKTYNNKKSPIMIAAEKEEAAKKHNKENGALVSKGNTISKKDLASVNEDLKTIAEKEKAKTKPKLKKVSYNLSDLDNDGIDKQSRESYRKNNLRPNGKKYDKQ